MLARNSVERLIMVVCPSVGLLQRGFPWIESAVLFILDSTGIFQRHVESPNAQKHIYARLTSSMQDRRGGTHFRIHRYNYNMSNRKLPNRLMDHNIPRYYQCTGTLHRSCTLGVELQDNQ